MAVKASSNWAGLDVHRGSAQQRGYTKAWGRARLAFLAGHPLCSHCQAEGRLVGATVVDHVRPHRGDLAAFWAGALQALCKTCHGRKARRENRLVPCAHRLMVGEVCAHCGRVPAQQAANQ